MKYFKYSDMIRSNTASDKNINNIPTSLDILDNIQKTLEQLEQIREAFGYPIIITSGYRCTELNKAVGGVSNSHHLKGMAADIITKKGNMRKLYELIKTKFKYTQLIWENNGNWIHFSYDSSDLKKQTF